MMTSESLVLFGQSDGSVSISVRDAYYIGTCFVAGCDAAARDGASRCSANCAAYSNTENEGCDGDSKGVHCLVCGLFLSCFV